MRGGGCLPSGRHLVTRSMISGLATASLKLKSIIFGLDSKPGNAIKNFQLLYQAVEFGFKISYGVLVSII